MGEVIPSWKGHDGSYVKRPTHHANHMKLFSARAAAALVTTAAVITLSTAIIPGDASARPRDPRARCSFDDDDPNCEDQIRGPKLNAKGEYEVEINDWKNPPKNIPWSKIVTIKSPFETYKAVWDQDYKGSSCFLSCNFYNGFTSRWTGEALSVAWFSTTCYSGNCSKRWQNIDHGVEVQVNGQDFTVYGHGDDMVMPSKLRKAILLIPEPKISLRISGNNSSIYNIGPETSKSIHLLVKENADEDAQLGSRGGQITLSPAIEESEKVSPVLKRTIVGVAQINTPKGKGTGFLIDKSGLLLTNRHVVGRFKRVEVQFNNGETYKADVIGKTADLDVALLQLTRKPSRGVKPLPICVRRDAPVGTDVVVIGNPKGLRATTTRGIVSAIRNEDGAAIMQIDAPINSGNSGGPIVNYNGEAVGIVTSKMVGLGIEGLGFGISMPSALESLGVEIKSQPLMPDSKLTSCGNLIL